MKGQGISGFLGEWRTDLVQDRLATTEIVSCAREPKCPGASFSPDVVLDMGDVLSPRVGVPHFQAKCLAEREFHAPQ
jgi:hypothetical protein